MNGPLIQSASVYYSHFFLSLDINCDAVATTTVNAYETADFERFMADVYQTCPQHLGLVNSADRFNALVPLVGLETVRSKFNSYFQMTIAI